MKPVAFLGVISKDSSVPFYRLYEKSVKGDPFRLFLRELKKHHGKGDFCLYLDNLKMHYSNATWDVYDELGIHPVFAPKYSPEYNPIELVFSKLKEWTRRQRLQDMLKERKRTYWELVPLAVD